MVEPTDFKAGDYVAVVGGRLKNEDGEEKIEPSIKVGRVLFVGKQDMIIEEPGWSFPTKMTVPKSRCSLVNVKPDFANPFTFMTPKLGDMVLSHKFRNSGESSETTLIGVLMEINAPPGGRARGSILVAGDLVEIELNESIVMQRKESIDDKE